MKQVFVFSKDKGCLVNKATGEEIQSDKEWVPVAPYFMPDIGEFRSPIDDSIITSRTQLAEHNKRHGVIQIGNDQGNIIEKTNKKNAAIREKARGLTGGWTD